MSRITETIREKGQKLVDGSILWGYAPFVGGVAVANEVLKDNLPSAIRVALVIGAGCLTYDRTHYFLNNEASLTEDANIRLKEPTHPSQEQLQ